MFVLVIRSQFLGSRKMTVSRIYPIFLVLILVERNTTPEMCPFVSTRRVTICHFDKFGFRFVAIKTIVFLPIYVCFSKKCGFKTYGNFWTFLSGGILASVCGLDSNVDAAGCNLCCTIYHSVMLTHRPLHPLDNATQRRTHGWRGNEQRQSDVSSEDKERMEAGSSESPEMHAGGKKAKDRSNEVNGLCV